MKKTYISPDIIVVEMENNLMVDVISRNKVTTEADDSEANPDKPGTGKGPAPASSKDNAFDPWNTWDD